MIKRTAAEWQALFAEQRQSGLSARTFCKTKGLCPKYFSLRQKQLPGKPLDRHPTVFIRAAVPSQSQPGREGIYLHHGSSELRLPTTTAPQWLAEFLKALA